MVDLLLLSCILLQGHLERDFGVVSALDMLAALVSCGEGGVGCVCVGNGSTTVIGVSTLSPGIHQ